MDIQRNVTQISVFQIALLLAMAMNSTAILTAPAITVQYAQRDLWLSPLFSSVSGIIVLFLAIHLNRRFPGMTVIQYSEYCIGKWPGKIISGIFLLVVLHIGSIIVREYAEFVKGMFLDETPLLVIICGMVILSTYATRSGIEVIGRLAQLFVPGVMLTWVILLLLTIPDWDVMNIFPAFDGGILPAIRGSITPQGWFSEMFLLSFLLPHLKKNSPIKKWMIIMVVFAAINLSILNIISLFVFGNLVPTLTYPVMSLIRYVNIADFLQHIDALLLIIWVIGVFLKIVLFQYCIASGCAQWLNVEKFRPLVLPLGFLMVLFSLWSASSMQDLSAYLKDTSFFYAMIFFLIYPLGLFLIAIVRKPKIRRD
ncbi:germination protein [Pullulanibacillus camelliae]|uniref:Germination protein n=1 Tax=Pullulanibacillus camelliae TaxID=1707096 RepID=A0A8J2YMA3_9BACL|nr:endospore germination permease [Pullulanibacillus camelliae]GGE52716.1 germination protein [Pullulanibacillus camelliae]